MTSLLQNATLRDAAAGLAVSAGYQASTQRFYLWQNRDVIVQPFGVSVADVVQAISNYRDSLDGPAVSAQAYSLQLCLQLLTNQQTFRVSILSHKDPVRFARSTLPTKHLPKRSLW